jgi:hypothetical protein
MCVAKHRDKLSEKWWRVATGALVNTILRGRRPQMAANGSKW